MQTINKGGRPRRIYPPEETKFVGDLYSVGMSVGDIANLMGRSRLRGEHG